MKQIRLLIISLLLTSICYSQTTIKGKIENAENNEPIAYVNIGVFGKRVGTISNDKGCFSLKLDKTINQNDTILFSIIGFKLKEIPLSNFSKEDEIIYLEPEIEKLREVTIFANKQETEIIGRNKKGGLTSKFFSPFDKDIDDRLSREQGMIFKIKNTCVIQDVNFHISLNEFKSVKLRLIFYKVKNGLPKEILNTNDIIINVENNYLGWYKIDMEKYHLILDKSLKEIAVTLQWIESEKENEKSERFGITAVNSLKKNALFREKGMDQWVKWGQTLSLYMNTNLK